MKRPRFILNSPAAITSGLIGSGKGSAVGSKSTKASNFSNCPRIFSIRALVFEGLQRLLMQAGRACLREHKEEQSETQREGYAKRAESRTAAVSVVIHGVPCSLSEVSRDRRRLRRSQGQS